MTTIYVRREVAAAMARQRSLRHHKPIAAGDAVLVTRRTALFLGLPATVDLIRKKAKPVACEVRTRTVLYDMDELARIFPSEAA